MDPRLQKLRIQYIRDDCARNMSEEKSITRQKLSRLCNHELQASGFTVNFDNVMTGFIFNKRTDA